MLTRDFAERSWSEDEYSSDEGDLVDILESYTDRLGALCGGLEEDDEESSDEVAVDVGDDTIASLEEMTGECAALLACLEAEGYSFDGADDRDFETPQEVNIVNSVSVEEEAEGCQPEELARELDSFADELNEFLSKLGETSPCSVDNSALKHDGSGHSSHCHNKTEAVVDIAVVAGSDGDEAKIKHNNHAQPPPQEVFSQRTKTAIAQHVKRLALRKQRPNSSGKQAILDFTHDLRAGAKLERAAGARVVWSKFQSSSFQQHITRQNFARRRVKQNQEAQRLVESTRLRGAIEIPHRRPTKSEKRESGTQATYLKQFKPTSAPASEFDPRYLCAVFLYGLRRLGTTFITFSSLAQLEQRVRARFGIHEVVSIYREVTELVVPERAIGYHSSKRHRLKRLQRISSLERVSDGDTLCVTQNAYDDMTILCDWMKQRQRVVYDFQHLAPQSSSIVSAVSFDEVTPPKPKASVNAAAKPQLWDSNGRSIGVKTREAI